MDCPAERNRRSGSPLARERWVSGTSGREEMQTEQMQKTARACKAGWLKGIIGANDCKQTQRDVEDQTELHNLLSAASNARGQPDWLGPEA